MSWAVFDQIVFAPDVPAPLVLLLALVLGPLTVWVYLRTSARLSRGRRGLLLLLRLLGLAGVLLILLQPSRLEKLPAPNRNKVTIVALDASRSMRQPDAGKLTRFDAARELLWDAGLVSRTEASSAGETRIFRFSDDAAPLTQPLAELKADGKTTRINQAVETMLGSLGPSQGAHALFLLTDGHDFDLVNPARTAWTARHHQVPIYAVPFGGEGTVRDVSVRFTSYQAFHYAKQKIRLGVSLRPLGCPYETLRVTLLREGQVLETRPVVVREEAQLPLQFEVTESKAGQFEYEVRVEPLAGEVDSSNNSATTYVNVIDKKIRVLVLEGRPYWDTTFLQRSLRHNEKLELDSVVGYAPRRFRVIRTEGAEKDLVLPTTPEQWNQYDLVLLGKAVDSLLSETQIEALETFVSQQGGVVIFSRADAFSGKSQSDLQPVAWGASIAKHAPLKISRDGHGVAPFRLLADATAETGQMPDMVGSYEAGEHKPLAATFAETEGANANAFPAMVHRRYGAGQVLSIGVDGLWRWAFNAKVDGGNTVFDRFWDQTLLWLMSGRDVMPSSRFTVRTDTANVLLGEKIHFRIVQRDPDQTVHSIPLIVRRDGAEIARIESIPAHGGDRQRYLSEFLPEQLGRYVAEAKLPDGTTQTARFIVYGDNAEETDVAADLTYLRRLCEASGGRVLKPAEFAAMLKAVKAEPVEEAAQTRRVTLWDRAWIFWLIGACFGADWYLRRKWGLC